jgi:hypothetical protein
MVPKAKGERDVYIGGVSDDDREKRRKIQFRKEGRTRKD